MPSYAMVKDLRPVIDHMPATPVARQWRLLYGVMLAGLAAAYVRALFIPLMNLDSGHHALIAMHMIESGDYAGLYFRGEDYLDKPHFLFWAVALSFKIFGINAFAYRLPSFLFSLLAIYATCRLGRKLYDYRTGFLAGLIVATSYAFVLANNDVRMDAILTGCIIFTLWQLIELADSRALKHVLFSALGLAVGFSTKGMIGLVMPLLAVFFYVIQKRNWWILLDLRWVYVGLLLILFLLPEFYSFYVQFDAHPEKVIRGQAAPSGIRFLLFGQSLERYQGGAWGSTGSDDPLMFVHTFFWAFLPWCLMGVPALWQAVSSLVKNKFKDDARHPLFLPATIGVIFLLISGSQFKLPHYLNILLPLYALITAAYVIRMEEERPAVILLLQRIVTTLMVILVIVLNTYVFPPDSFVVGLLMFFFLVMYIVVSRMPRARAALAMLAAATFTYVSLNFNFYPQMLRYQAGNMLADVLHDYGGTREKVCYLEGYVEANGFDVRVGRTIPVKSVAGVVNESRQWVYTDEDGLEALKQTGKPMEIVASNLDYRVSQFDIALLDPQRRGKAVKNYLIRIP
jgi:4-amino-4-deoxy-L-arabinose transferase-like glycosyltransferase